MNARHYVAPATTLETVQKVGVLWDRPVVVAGSLGMKWRVMLELIGPDGIVGVHAEGRQTAFAAD